MLRVMQREGIPAWIDGAGYTVSGILDDYPRPHQRFFMQKQLLAPCSPGSPHGPKE
jgi:hypothetical protein